ncbi:TPA: hypothetical protein ACVHP4_004242 [Yersinia enterocolitica]
MAPQSGLAIFAPLVIAALPLLSALLHHFSSFRAAKIGPVKQAITSIERSYLFLVGGILSGRFNLPNARLICVALLYHS